MFCDIITNKGVSVQEQKPNIAFKFDAEDEELIKAITREIEVRVTYDLRGMFKTINDLQKSADTGQRDQYGDPVYDWSRVSLQEFTAAYTDAVINEFASFGQREKAFIEAHLASSILDNVYYEIYTSLEPKLTATERKAQASVLAKKTKFKQLYRELYSKAVRERFKEYSTLVDRLTNICWLKRKEQEQDRNVAYNG